MEKIVHKEHHLNPVKISDIIRTYTEPKNILIVFWHGLGDTLMFLPLYDYIVKSFPVHHFYLSLLPGVGQGEFVGNRLELPESEFVVNHDAAFVISFPMVEGNNKTTKTENCCKHEIGLDIPEAGFSLPFRMPVDNKLVGLHLQGTCLPGSTNPDTKIADLMWNDIKNAGYVPIDLHFLHAFHNQANEPFPWTTRHCRDLKPSLTTLQMMMQNCIAVVAVASGPFVLSVCCRPKHTIYLQKHHTLNCYIRSEDPVYTQIKTVDLLAYSNEVDYAAHMGERAKLIQYINEIVRQPKEAVNG